MTYPVDKFGTELHPGDYVLYARSNSDELAVAKVLDVDCSEHIHKAKVISTRPYGHEIGSKPGWITTMYRRAVVLVPEMIPKETRKLLDSWEG